MDDELTWKLRVRRLDEELCELCEEARADGRLDRIDHVATLLFDLRQQLLDAHHIAQNGEAATKPYPWWAREWMRSTHWILGAELFAREDRMKKIRNRLLGPNREIDLLRRREEDAPNGLLDRIARRLFGAPPG